MSANNRDVNILINGHDRASGAFKQASGSAKRFESDLRQVGQRIVGVTTVVMVLDRGLRAVTDALDNSNNGEEFRANMAESTSELLKSVPIAGKLGELVARMNPEYAERLRIVRETAEWEARQTQQLEKARELMRSEQSIRSTVATARDKHELATAHSEEQRMQVAHRQSMLAIETRYAEQRERAMAQFQMESRREEALRQLREAERLEREAAEAEFARNRQRMDEAAEAEAARQRLRESLEQELAMRNQLAEAARRAQVDQSAGDAVMEARIAALRDEVALGDESVRNDLERLEIAREFELRQRRLQELLADQTLESQRRLELQRELDRLANQRQRRLAAVGREGASVADDAAPRRLDAFEARFLTTAPGAARANPAEQTQKLTEQLLESSHQQSKALITMEKSLKRIERERLVVATVSNN